MTARTLEQELAAAQALLLDADWAFRHLNPDLDLDSRVQAYRIAIRVQDYVTDWHRRRQAGERLPSAHPQEPAA